MSALSVVIFEVISYNTQLSSKGFFLQLPLVAAAADVPGDFTPAAYPQVSGQPAESHIHLV